MNRLADPLDAEAPCELPEAILNVPNPCTTASILRTHSQCQRGSLGPNITALSRGEPFLFIKLDIRAGWWSLSGSNR
ncbi:hypothetical protein [Sphingomonas sp. CROZ-RG-20F-R02-07]|uniref:hypothetical protein n=1 Tax=Sphingomonas sp. CROZ-RG-20F-R02-07 TaxID=2914832 RepID=UPI001F57EA97|nr:hypothetical protein [Sphingomonas sp. CROZ-RG-20F-R02-07]